ncbi:hypothetical protein BH10CYA1_BH10CYA1_46570 [soil metagenome]
MINANHNVGPNSAMLCPDLCRVFIAKLREHLGKIVYLLINTIAVATYYHITPKSVCLLTLSCRPVVIPWRAVGEAKLIS